MKRDKWTGEVVGRLHICNATCKDLAKECGYTAPYLSMLLTGKKHGTDSTIRRIFQCLEKLETKQEKIVTYKAVRTSLFDDMEDMSYEYHN